MVFDAALSSVPVSCSTGMPVKACHLNVCVILQERHFSILQLLQTYLELDSAKVQNNLSRASSVSVKEGIKSGSQTMSSGYIADL